MKPLSAMERGFVEEILLNCSRMTRLAVVNLPLTV